MKLYAEPLNRKHSGFYFDSLDDYSYKLVIAKQQYGHFEHSIEVISASSLEFRIFNYLNVNSDTIEDLFVKLTIADNMDTLERVALSWLIDKKHSNAFYHYDRVVVKQQPIEEYAENYFFELYDVPKHLSDFIDIIKFSRAISADVVQYDDYLICNPNDF